LLDEATTKDSSLMSGTNSCLKTDINLNLLLLKILYVQQKHC
jgi:hypothetical protein